jgi:hypothetical protein
MGCDLSQGFYKEKLTQTQMDHKGYILRKWGDNKNDIFSFETHIVSIDKLCPFLKKHAGDNIIVTNHLPMPFKDKFYLIISFGLFGLVTSYSRIL